MRNKGRKNCFFKNVLCSVLCTVIALGCMIAIPQFGMKAEAHYCSCFKWVTISEGSGYSDLYQEYRCTECDEVNMINYKRAEFFVRDRLYTQIASAKANAVISTDFGLYSTVHDDLFIWLSKRNDVTVVVDYQHEGTVYQTTFPAGADYSEFLQDTQLFYGMPGMNGKCGVTTLVGETIVGNLSAIGKLKGAEQLYARIGAVPQNATVYFDLENVHTVQDSLFNSLAKRNDVTVVITYKYKDQTYKTTFPAGADYFEFLTDSQQFYGMLGLSGRVGITTAICE